MGIDKLTPLIDTLLKVGGLGIGVMVAVYIKPLGSAITELRDEMREMRGDLAGVKDSVNELNKSVAVMFQKHETKEIQITELTKDVRTLRERMHDLVNKWVVKIDHNAMRLDKIEKK